MSTKLKEQEIVEKFLSDNEFSKINKNLMNFNILEITGMGTQETKHSNILGWLFEDTIHQVGYDILNGFLQKIINENERSLDALKYYIGEEKESLSIYREIDNIDLLIVDEKNKVVITIENKVFAEERIEKKDCGGGDPLGQLKCYKKKIDAQYEDDWKKFFIFLTIDGENPSEGNEIWLRAKHQNITDVMIDILHDTSQILLTETRIIFESYIDLLKRNGIIEDKKLKELCEEIWDKHGVALDIIMMNRPNIKSKLNKIIQDYEGIKIQKKFEVAASTTYILDFNNDSIIKFIIQYSTTNRKIKFSLISNSSFDKININGSSYKSKSVQRHKYSHTTTYTDICSEQEVLDVKNNILLKQLELTKAYFSKKFDVS